MRPGFLGSIRVSLKSSVNEWETFNGIRGPIIVLEIFSSTTLWVLFGSSLANFNTRDLIYLSIYKPQTEILPTTTWLLSFCLSDLVSTFLLEANFLNIRILKLLIFDQNTSWFVCSHLTSKDLNTECPILETEDWIFEMALKRICYESETIIFHTRIGILESNK